MTKFRCLCCGFLTLDEKPGEGTFETCPVCYWDDDPVQDRDPDFEGGANRPSLNQARENFRRIGAKEERLLPFVRQPTPDERGE